MMLAFLCLSYMYLLGRSMLFEDQITLGNGIAHVSRPGCVLKSRRCAMAGKVYFVNDTHQHLPRKVLRLGSFALCKQSSIIRDRHLPGLLCLLETIASNCGAHLRISESSVIQRSLLREHHLASICGPYLTTVG